MTENNHRISELPHGWIVVSIKECLLPIRGISFPKEAKHFNKGLGLIACLRTANIQTSVDWQDLWFVDESYVRRDNQIIQKGDILISIANSLELLGKVAIVDRMPHRATLGTFIANLRAVHPFKNKFFYYYFLCHEFKCEVREKASTTTNISNISVGKLEKISVKLPPLREQHRIVAKIEELFSELDNGIASLKTAQAQLKTYRQAVLKWAFEGKLTETWREEQQQQGTLQTAAKLLQTIQMEREKRYQEQLTQWQAKVTAWEASGKSGKKPTRPKKPKELPPLSAEELARLPALPEGWGWIKLGKLTLGVEYGTSAKSKKEGTIPVLRMGNIQNCIFNWSDLVYSDDDDEIERYLLEKGDVLFNRTNSPELVGKTAIFHGERKAIFAGYLIRVNQINKLVIPNYLNYFLNSIVAKKYGNTVKTDGVNQSNINGQKLTNYPFPYTSPEEQHQIVQEIEARLSICDQLEATIADNLDKAEALRQSILKRAFEGKLVPQDPNDEPAAELLKRIQADKKPGKAVQQLELNLSESYP